MKYTKDDFIKKLIQHEGLRLEVYQDTLGIDTIGIGRNLEDRGITEQELSDLGIPNIEHVYESGITEVDAVYLATNDVDCRDRTCTGAPLRRQARLCASAYTYGHGI